MPEKKTKWTKVNNPESLFADWQFDIKKAHWPALGVVRREYTNSVKTQALRDKWALRNPRYNELQSDFFGKASKLSVKEKKAHPDKAEWETLTSERIRYKISYFSWTKSKPAAYKFEVGDTFWCVDGLSYLQVIAGGAVLEVKYHVNGESFGYQVDSEQLGEWLASGQLPEKKCRISRNESRSEIAQFHEYTE